MPRDDKVSIENSHGRDHPVLDGNILPAEMHKQITQKLRLILILISYAAMKIFGKRTVIYAVMNDGHSSKNACNFFLE